MQQKVSSVPENERNVLTSTLHRTNLKTQLSPVGFSGVHILKKMQRLVTAWERFGKPVFGSHKCSCLV